MPDRASGLRYQNVEGNLEENLDTLYRNTAIPDETFGPDEERIFIDVDPYDLDDSMFGLQHSDPVKITPVASKGSPMTPTIARADNDYVEESLKSVKRQWQNVAEGKGRRNSTPMVHKEAVNAVTTSGNIGLEMYYVPDSSTKHDSSEESRSREADRRNHDGSVTEHVFSTISFKRVDDDSKREGTKDAKTEISNRTDDYREVLQDEMKKRRVYVENDTVDDAKDLEDDLSQLALTEERGSAAIEQHQDAKNASRNQEDRNGSPGEAVEFRERSTKEETQEANKSSELATTATVAPNPTVESTISSLTIVGTNTETSSFNRRIVRVSVIIVLRFANQLTNVQTPRTT